VVKKQKQPTTQAAVGPAGVEVSGKGADASDSAGSSLQKASPDESMVAALEQATREASAAAEHAAV